MGCACCCWDVREIELGCVGGRNGVSIGESDVEWYSGVLFVDAWAVGGEKVARAASVSYGYLCGEVGGSSCSVIKLLLFITN